MSGLLGKLMFTPELQRLREVSMSNIDSLSFPSIAKISRFEHSIGCAHLGRIVGDTLNLSRSDREILTAACLLHDAGTPPFGHLLEGVYSRRFGFNHERKLLDFFMAGPDLRTAYEPLFSGALAKSRDVLSSASYLVDYREVFRLIRGEGRYGRLLVGPIDLDNVDNVFRMAYHMGITDEGKAAPRWVRSFQVSSDGKVQVTGPEGEALVASWQRAREQMYERLMLASSDLSLKTMLTEAIEIGLDGVEGHPPALTKDDWLLTDWELIRRLSDYPPTAELVRRIRLADLYAVIGRYWVVGEVVRGLLASQELQGQILSEFEGKSGRRAYIHLIPERRYRDLSGIKWPDLTNFRILEYRGSDSGDIEPQVLLAVLSAERSIRRQDQQIISAILREHLGEDSVYPVDARPRTHHA